MRPAGTHRQGPAWRTRGSVISRPSSGVSLCQCRGRQVDRTQATVQDQASWALSMLPLASSYSQLPEVQRMDTTGLLLTHKPASPVHCR